MLKLSNFSVFLDQKQLIDRVTLSLEPGSYHVLLGKNGSGKSTLALALAGHPQYKTSGEAFLDGSDLLTLPAHERSLKGLFVLFQQPYEIPALSVLTFLYEIARIHTIYTGQIEQFSTFLKPLLLLTGFDESILSRHVHQGFSGGEKKRFELLQMLLLKPRVVILDEPDSGLDIGAVSRVHDCIQQLYVERPETIILLITHYAQLFAEKNVTAVHVLDSGKLTHSGSKQFGENIFAKGFDHGTPL